MNAQEIVFVVEDDASLRNSLAWMFDSNGISCATFDSAHTFMLQAVVNCPSCLILDLALPGMSGIDLLREIGKRPELAMPIIILTGRANVPAAVECMKLGVADFLEKPIEHGILLAKIRELLAIDVHRREQREKSARLKQRVDRLTDREREVLSLLCEGKSTKEIAAQINISIKTVSIHRWHLMKKMQVGSATEAVRLAHDASFV
jgi:RNA polymerase sigma factor (sigma-70 family)